MKKIVLLAFALIAPVVTFAQVPMATLDHNDTITVFYSDQALKRAYEAAVDGDIITLSEGTFDAYGFHIAKNNLTIRGAGMFYDSVAGTVPTILPNLLIVDNGTSGCVFEGFYCNILHFKGASNCRINRCRANVLNDWNEYSVYPSEGHVFNSCVFHSAHFQYGQIRNSCFYNCIFACDNDEDCDAFALGGRNSFQQGDQNRLINCYVQVLNCDEVDNEAEFYNCIIYSSRGYSTSNIASHNCIGVKYNNEGFLWDTTSSTNIANNLINLPMDSVFVNFDGTYHPGVDNLELTPAAQAILGYDGTQIGIYGGQHPFNPHLNTHTPIIGHVTVPHSSNAQGRLDVDVEVITQP